MIAVPDTGLRSSGLLNSPNLNEFDAVIWHPSNTLIEISSQGYHENFVNAFRKKISELVEWASRGHSLIVITSTPINPITYVSGGKQLSHRLDQEEPFAGVTFERATGKLIEFCGPASLEALMAVDWLHYSVILKSKDMIPLLKVSKSRFGSDQLVGGIKKIGKGLVVFVPPLKDEAALAFSEVHYTNLASVSEHFEPLPDELPDWTARYQMDAERAALNHIAKLEAQIGALQLQVSEQLEVVQTAQSLKQLFVGTGDALVNAVAEAMKELGLKIADGPRGRADLIGYDGARVVALEVKGLEGSAKENNLRQTERWVADIRSALTSSTEQTATDTDLGVYAEKLRELGVPEGVDINCKGIMVIGTHRKMPLADRNEPSFPDPVARPINRSEVCALSGLQLLGLLLETKKGQYEQIGGSSTSMFDKRRSR